MCSCDSIMQSFKRSVGHISFILPTYSKVGIQKFVSSVARAARAVVSEVLLPLQRSRVRFMFVHNTNKTIVIFEIHYNYISITNIFNYN